MDSAQKELFKLLLEIDEICRKYDIQYFMDYGTMLGAVRHEGFIPWDNDIDITMTEDNYYRWIDACKKELNPEKRVFCDGRLDREYPTVFGRYINLETFRVSRNLPFWRNLCGQCIDVFCLLELPGDSVKKQKAIERFYAYDEYYMGTYRHYRNKSRSEMKLYRRYCRIGNIIGKERLLSILEKRIFHQHYADCDTYLVDSARKRGGPTPIVPKECYDTVYMANYEGHKLPIPGKYIELLTLYYGDSYCMLPEKKRIHSPMSDAGVKCVDYVDDYMRYIDKKVLLKELWEIKNYEVEEGYRAMLDARDYFVKLGHYIGLKLKETVEEKKIDINSFLDVSDMDKLAFLNDFFKTYYEKQLHDAVLYWEIYFEVDDNLVYAALITLLYYQRNYNAVLKILDLRKINNREIEGRWKELYDLIAAIRKTGADIHYGDYEMANACLESYLAKYPYCHALQVNRLSLDVLLVSNESDYSSCEQKAYSLLEKYPKDEQCIKALGDLAVFKKNYDAAEKHYGWLMEHSSNGMYHLDIKKKRETYND